MKTFMQYILLRAKERSTWLGLTAAISAIGVNISPEYLESIITVGVAVAGLVAMLTADSTQSK